MPRDKYSSKQASIETKLHVYKNTSITIVPYRLHRESKKIKKGRSCPAQLSHTSYLSECRERENRGIVQIYHTYSSAESSMINVRFRLFGFFSLWYLVSGLRVHTAHVFSIRGCVMDMPAGRAEANAGRRRAKIDALVRKTKEWLGKCKIGMSDKNETARGEVRKALATDHLFRAISRAALISGASVRNDSDIAKNGCCNSCVASGRLSASTSSVFAR
jgi:hypothetical protein